jgi:hypothetical protein
MPGYGHAEKPPLGARNIRELWWSGAAGRAIVRCAEYEPQLGGGSPLSSLMTAKD